jgi:hypothetical protein
MSGRKKGLNIDEKRKRILAIFTESCDVYQLKVSFGCLFGQEGLFLCPYNSQFILLGTKSS